jgi:hypothetical protein
MKIFFEKYWSLLVTIISLLVLICFALLIIPESQMPTLLQSSGLVAIISAFLGVVMTVAVTAILLDKQAATQKELMKNQSESEELKERNMKVFEKKQEVYHHFLEQLQKIIQDGKITTIGVKREDGTIDRTIDKIKDLIFQLSYIQLHASTEETKEVLKYIAIIIQVLNDFDSTKEEDKHKELNKFYSNLFKNLFEIVAILKSDLYGKDIETIPEAEIESILKKFELYAEVIDMDKHAIQLYFWNELRDLLKEKGYKLEEKDFKQAVNEFYAGNKWNGTELEVEDGTWLSIHLEQDNFFYGFCRENSGAVNTELEQRIKNTSSLFKSNKWWYGLKNPDRYKFDFWSLQSKDFEELKNLRKRDNIMRELADEIDRYVKKFRQTK